MSCLTVNRPSLAASHTPAAGPMMPAPSEYSVAGGRSGLGAVGVPVCTAQAAGSPGRAPPHRQPPAATDGLPHGALLRGVALRHDACGADSLHRLLWRRH